MVMHLLYALIMITFVYPWLSTVARAQLERGWNKGLLNILNIKLRFGGEVPDLSVKNVMLVANHISWLDIYLLNAVRPVRFVSKIEVRSWPIVGFLASRTGTLFIDRTKRHDTKRVNHEVSTALSNGACMAVFPEGTTSDGSLMRPFHASLLQPAIHSQSKIWPAAIRYTHVDGSINSAPAYIDDLTFADSLLLILSQKIIYAEIEFLPPIHAHGKERRDLAKEAERVIACALNLNESIS